MCLRRRYGETKPYFKVIESQGRLLNSHYHIIIFDIDFLMEEVEFTIWLNDHLISFLSNFGNYYRKTINKRSSGEGMEALSKYGRILLRSILSIRGSI